MEKRKVLKRVIFPGYITHKFDDVMSKLRPGDIIMHDRDINPTVFTTIRMVNGKEVSRKDYMITSKPDYLFEKIK